MIDDSLQSITPESVGELHSRYIFLKNEIPALESEILSIQKKVSEAQLELKNITDAKNTELSEREQAISKREQAASNLEQELVKKESSLCSLQNEISRSQSYNSATQLTIQDLINQDVIKKHEIEILQKQLNSDRDKLNADLEKLEKDKTEYHIYRADIEDSFREKEKELSKKQAELDGLVIKNKDLLNSLALKLIEAENQKNAPTDLIKQAEIKLEEANSKLATLSAKELALSKAEKELSEKQTLLNSKELDLKAIKVQLDKKEAKIKEIISNSGFQLSDIPL